MSTKKTKSFKPRSAGVHESKTKPKPKAKPEGEGSKSTKKEGGE